MADPKVAAAAEVAAARRKIRQASDLIRRASQRLAEAQDLDLFGVQRVETRADADAACGLIALAHAEHAQIEVVVLTCIEKHPSIHGPI